MRRFRAWAAIAAWMGATLLLSACASHLKTAPVVAMAPTPTPTPEPVRPEPTTPQQVSLEIFRWFRAAGYRRFQAAALMAQARDESGYRPCAASPTGFRYLYQWGGWRLQALHSFANTPGCPPLRMQLAFANRELQGEPKYACFFQTATPEAALAALRRGFGHGSC